MDVVYVYRKWPINGIELRYSLRSLSNIEHWDVYIVWYKPDWIQNIIHIPMQDNLWSKYKNVINKYKTICEDERISDNFVLMNDDIYFLKEILEIPYYTRGSLKELVRYYKEKYWQSSYMNVVEKVYNLYPDWASFNCHCPIVYNKKKLKKLLDKIEDDEISIRSLYWNKYKVKGVEYWGDCKVFKWSMGIKDWEYLSTSDGAIYTTKIKEFLKRKFPKKCDYEK